MSLIFARRVTGTLAGFSVAMHPDGTYVAVARSTSPWVGVVPWSAAGFGSPVADPGTAIPGAAHGVAWSPDGNYLAVAHETSPFVTVYNWTGTGFGSKVADPATLPPSQANAVAWSPNGATLVAGGTSGAWLKAWAWSGGWGAFLNNAPGLFGTVDDIAFNPSGTHLAAAIVQTPRVHAWAISGAGFGAKVADPATLPAGSGQTVDFSDDGAYVAVAHSNSPYVTVYNWSAGFGSKIADPATLPVGAQAARFSPGSTHLVSGATVTLASVARNVLAWEWSGGFGSLVAHPDLQPGSVVRDITFAPAGNVITVGTSAPSLTGYVSSLFYVGRLPVA